MLQHLCQLAKGKHYLLSIWVASVSWQCLRYIPQIPQSMPPKDLSSNANGALPMPTQNWRQSIFSCGGDWISKKQHLPQWNDTQQWQGYTTNTHNTEKSRNHMLRESTWKKKTNTELFHYHNIMTKATRQRQKPMSFPRAMWRARHWL